MDEFARTASIGGGFPEVCRLGLATRGNTHLDPADVRRAIDAGVNYLNWCGHPDGLSRAIRELSAADRERVVVATQLMAKTAPEAERELDATLKTLKTEYLDVPTFYYVEGAQDWGRIAGAGGALEALCKGRDAGKVRLIGITTHERSFAADVARGGLVDLLMIRYNAAHRGAESEVFPIARAMRTPVVAYTSLRWKGLLDSTPEKPAEFRVPTAQECYRFVLGHPDVAVALMAPNGRAELEADLSLLGDWKPLSQERYAALCAHGDRVHRHKGAFP